MRARRLFVVVAIAWAAAARPAVARESLALWLDGREAGQLERTIRAALPALFAPVAAAAVKRAVAQDRAARGRASSLTDHVRAVAGRLGSSVLYAQVDNRRRLHLVLVRADAGPFESYLALGPPASLAAAISEFLGGEPAATVSAPAPRLPASSAIAPPSAKRAPPTRAAPAAIVAPAIVDAPSAGSDAEVAAVPAPATPAEEGSLLALALDGGVGARRLEYNQRITPNLPSYSVAAVPWLGVRGHIYPFARTSVPVLRDFGVVADFGHSLYQQSVVAGGGPTVSATWSSFDLGVRERIPFGRSGLRPTVGVGFAYGGTSYNFEQGGQLISETPSVDYRYLRPSVDGRISFGPVTLSADAGYRGVLSSGYVGSRFPHARVGGVDVGARLEIRLPRNLEIAIAGQYARFFYDLRPEPGDPYVAGGALDEYAVGELAFGVAF